LWVTTLVSRAFHWREHLLPVISFAVPFLYWMSWKYWNNDADNLVLFRKILTYDARVFFYEFNWVDGLLLAALAVTLLLALPRYLFLSDRASNKARSVKTVFLIMAVAMCLSMVLGYLLILKWILLVVLMPVTFIVGYWFTNYRYSLIAPFVFYFLCAACTMVVFHFYHLVI
jgi:hypothetical protein